MGELRTPHSTPLHSVCAQKKGVRRTRARVEKRETPTSPWKVSVVKEAWLGRSVSGGCMVGGRSALRIGRTVRSTCESSSRSKIHDPTHFATHDSHQKDSRRAILLKIHVCCVKKHGRSVFNRHRHRHRLHNSILQQPCYASLSCRMQPVVIRNNAARQ
jgi:hypothetical protein